MAIAYNIIDLGISEFKDTWNLQKELQEKRILGEIEDQLILVEHPAVYTLGKNASKDHILKKKKVFRSFKLIEEEILLSMDPDSSLGILY